MAFTPVSFRDESARLKCTGRSLLTYWPALSRTQNSYIGVNRVTLAVGRPFSGLPRSADILGVRRHVSNGPIPDIAEVTEYVIAELARSHRLAPRRQDNGAG
jgi:hypothetical protein